MSLEVTASSLMDQYSRHDIPPAVTETYRPTRARSSSRAYKPGLSQCSLVGGSMTRLTGSTHELVDPH